MPSPSPASPRSVSAPRSSASPRAPRWKLDLGLSSLRADWASLFRPEHLRADLVAGVTVGAIALPLSLAIAIASDVAPVVGLTTAIIGSIVAALLGGARLAVTGPANAVYVLVGQIVLERGLGGLVVVVLGAGLLQVLSGVVGLGRFVRLVPLSVVHGFTAGIGVLILVGQLPRALGLPAPDASHVLEVLRHVTSLVHDAHPTAVAIASFSMLTALLVPRRFPRVPAALLAVVLPTALAVTLRWSDADVPLVGAIPSGLPWPTLPAVPTGGWIGLAGDAFVVYAIVSLESLLSSSALDKMRPGEPRTDHDQELIGQGLANMAVALFGGIPVTSVIARSALNVQSGARTRRAAIVHAGVLVLAVTLLGPAIAYVPVSALAGVLLATGIRMLSPGHVIELWRAARSEAFVFVGTVVAMVAADLLAGIQAGVLLALVVALARLARARVEVIEAEGAAPHTVSLSGAVTFLATPTLDRVAARVSQLDPAAGLTLDLRDVFALDASGAAHVLAVVHAFKSRGGAVTLVAPRAEVRQRLLTLHGDEIAPLLTRGEAPTGEDTGGARRDHARRRLGAGVRRFRREVRPELSPLFAELAAGQQPHTLFIACADSRVVPTLMTGTQPGELFVLRNIGALVPSSGDGGSTSEAAALEYAIRVLGVRHVVVCGHSGCGAVTALKNGGLPDELGAIHRWSDVARGLAGDLSGFLSVDDAAKAVAVRQLDHLATHPAVREGVESGQLSLAAWFYDVEGADVLEWHPAESRYVPVGESR